MKKIMTCIQIKPPVSDHAVLRWIERFGFVDVEAIRRQIYLEAREALNAGATRIQINGSDYRMRDGVVTTVIFDRAAGRKLDWRGKK